VKTKYLQDREQKISIIYKLIKFFSINDDEKVSKHNRLTNSYIYGFEDVISQSNRIIHSSVLTEQVDPDEIK
jgi:hypothetical protein